jgi:hypothetical protein
VDFFGNQVNIVGTRVKWSPENKRGIKMIPDEFFEIANETGDGLDDFAEIYSDLIALIEDWDTSIFS